MHSGKRFIPLIFVQLWLVAVLAGCGGGGTMDEAAIALSRGETQKAVEIYKYQAEEKKNAMAMRQLGIIYMSGQGVPKDYAAAEVWFQEGVKAGDGMSGTMLESLRAMRAAEGGGGTSQASSGGGNSKAPECARKKSNCRTACSAAPSAYGYGTSSRSGCYAGCDAKYNSCMK